MLEHIHLVTPVAERKGWLGERVPSLQRSMEIPGEIERNDARNINSINNMRVHEVQMI